MLRFTLNNTVIENPIGWDEIALNINRDLETNFIYCAYEGELTFTGESYSILYDIYKTDTFCSTVPLLIEYKCQDGQYSKLTLCNILISDCEFNIFRCEVKAKVVDDTWGSRINNNKSIKVNLGVTKTKNFFDLLPPVLEDIYVFDNAGTYLPNPRKGFRVYEAFRSLIGFMTDNNVVFVSDYFYNGAGQYYFLFTGASIRRTAPFYTEISFDSLYKELNKKIRLGMAFYEIAGVSYVRIENADYFYDTNVSKQFNNVKDIKLSFDLTRLYSSISIGSTNVLQFDQCDNGNNDCAFGQIPFYTWDNEEVPVLGKQCNIDKKLDLLSTELVIDSNVIQNLIDYSSNVNQWDKSLIIIDCYNDSGTIKAVKTDFLGVNLYWFNDAFTNKQVLLNWFNGIGNIYSSYLQGYLQSFVYAANQEGYVQGYIPDTSHPVYLVQGGALLNAPVQAPLPLSDDYNLWKDLYFNQPNEINYYDVPFTANYYVELEIWWNASLNPLPLVATPVVEGCRADNNGQIIDVFFGTSMTDLSSYALLTATVFCNQGDMIAFLFGAFNSGVIDPDFYYMQISEIRVKIYSTINNYIPPEPTENFLSRKVKYDKYVTYQDLVDLKTNPLMQINVNQDQSNTFNGWINEAKIPVKTLKGEFMLTNK